MTRAALAFFLVSSCPAVAQAGNPFVPGGGLDKAQVDRIIADRLIEFEKRIMEKIQSAPPVAGAPGMPGAVPTVDGAGLPVGGPGMAPSLPAEKGVIETSGAKMVGCINGQHVFKSADGGRMMFPPRDVQRALADGVIRACR